MAALSFFTVIIYAVHYNSLRLILPLMKEAHVYIYGIIDYWQNDDAVKQGIVNLKSIKLQLDAAGSFDEITVHIHSLGGDVSEGFAIHDYLRSFGKPVTTIAEGNCHSIATVPFLAGDKRIMAANAEMVIHNPWGSAGGERGEIQKYADELGRIENKMADFYASKTNLTKDDALVLMNATTTLTSQEALERGFVTEITPMMRAVALYNPTKLNNNMSEFIKKEEADKKFASISERLNQIWNKIIGKIQNKIVQDANGLEIDFYELSADDVPKLGDKATIDGAAVNGSYVMPSGETFVFANGELTEIIAAANNDLQNLQKENADLKAEIDALKTANVNALNNVKEANEKIAAIGKEIKALKATLGSSFNYTPEIDPHQQQQAKNIYEQGYKAYKQNNPK